MRHDVLRLKVECVAASATLTGAAGGIAAWGARWVAQDETGTVRYCLLDVAAVA